MAGGCGNSPTLGHCELVHRGPEALFTGGWETSHHASLRENSDACLVPRALVLTQHLAYAMHCAKRNTDI